LNLRVEIILVGQQLQVNFPHEAPGHALKMLESARVAIENKMLEREQQPQIEVPAGDLVSKLNNGRPGRAD
jgi:hypothetical protein